MRNSHWGTLKDLRQSLCEFPIFVHTGISEGLARATARADLRLPD
jgi:hypothetical protein